jgi:hypothetical protein
MSYVTPWDDTLDSLVRSILDDDKFRERCEMLNRFAADLNAQMEKTRKESEAAVERRCRLEEVDGLHQEAASHAENAGKILAEAEHMEAASRARATGILDNAGKEAERIVLQARQDAATAWKTVNDGKAANTTRNDELDRRETDMAERHRKRDVRLGELEAEFKQKRADADDAERRAKALIREYEKKLAEAA